MKSLRFLPVFFCLAQAAPKLRMNQNQLPASLLTLPSNATSIRADIEDSFSCEGRDYGYYADVENDCQLFHVCLPVTYSNGRSQTFRWSFICPEDTVFNQEIFTCTRSEESIECAESPRYYNLNMNFGDDMMLMSPDLTSEEHSGLEPGAVSEIPQELETMNEEKEKAPEALENLKNVIPIYNRRM